MKTILKDCSFKLALVGTLLLALSAPALAHDGPGGNLGVGLGVGAPTGLSVELALDRSTSLEAAVGFDAFNTGGYIHLVGKFNVARLSRGPTVSVPLYLGIGGYMFDNSRDFDSPNIGVRAPVGVSFDFRRSPIQLFIEVALGADLVRDDASNRLFWFGGYGGIRFWF